MSFGKFEVIKTGKKRKRHIFIKRTKNEKINKTNNLKRREYRVDPVF